MESLSAPHEGIDAWGRQLIVISGSSGLIGSQLITHLSKQYTIIGLDKPGAPYPPEAAECMEMDITSDESVQQAFSQIRARHGNRIASFVHLAAYYDFSGKPSPLYQKITVDGTARLLGFLKSFEVEQFIFSSSLLVYQSAPAGKKITEDAPLGATWDYPESKLKTEALLRVQRGNMPLVLLRIAGVYTDACQSIPIAHQIQRIYEKDLTSHFYPGHLAHGSPFVHLQDVVAALLRTIEKRKDLPAEAVVNIGEAGTVSYGTLQQTIARFLYGKEWATYRIPKAIAKAGAWVQNIFGNPFIKPWMVDRADDHAELDISRAETWLGWHPEHALLQTIPKMIAALKDDPQQWYRLNKLKK